MVETRTTGRRPLGQSARLDLSGPELIWGVVDGRLPAGVQLGDRSLTVYGPPGSRSTPRAHAAQFTLHAKDEPWRAGIDVVNGVAAECVAGACDHASVTLQLDVDGDGWELHTI